MYTNADTVNYFKQLWFARREKYEAQTKWSQAALCDYHIARLNMLAGNEHIGLPFDLAVRLVNNNRRDMLIVSPE